MIDNETKVWVVLIVAATVGIFWGGIVMFGLALGGVGL